MQLLARVPVGQFTREAPISSSSVDAVARPWRAAASSWPAAVGPGTPRLLSARPEPTRIRHRVTSHCPAKNDSPRRDCEQEPPNSATVCKWHLRYPVELSNGSCSFAEPVGLCLGVIDDMDGCPPELWGCDMSRPSIGYSEGEDGISLLELPGFSCKSYVGLEPGRVPIRRRDLDHRRRRERDAARVFLRLRSWFAVEPR